MNRKDMVLACMAPASGGAHSPVQMQKLLFLIDRELAGEVGGPHFAFRPYHYGPFDQEVYSTLDELAAERFITILGTGSSRRYLLTVTGQQRGADSLRSLPSRAKDYIDRVSEWARALSFTQLVSSIYKEYPSMRANSVFQG